MLDEVITIKSGISFIATHIEVFGNIPVKIDSNHIFRRARAKEIEDIRQAIIQQAPYYWVRYDCSIRKKVINENNVTFYYEELEKEKWNYWVIAFNGSNYEVYQLEKLALLLPVELDICLQFLYSEENQEGNIVTGHCISPHIIEKYTNAKYHSNPMIRQITSKQISLIGELRELQLKISNNFQFINDAIDGFAQLRRIPDSSNLLTIGYFSLIELLITDEPKTGSASISHQITYKMILLRKKYFREIPLIDYFDSDIKEGTIWKKLYDYRSTIAHGSFVNFKQKFDVLKNSETTLSFLKENIKELICLALKEPEFFSDLRKC